MPCILKVRIIAGRNLPVMDRATDLTDAFVEVRFADYEAHRTAIVRKSLNPTFNEDFRFEVSDDSDLQNEPLAIRVMDYDQLTYNDSIGTIFIDLNPLLTWESNAQISGWFPIYDTLFGIRGELNCQVRLQFFGDINPFKDSSAGVQFYSSAIPTLPSTSALTAVLGFVSAIDNEDDPEYHWTDNFRTPRKSNEARTLVMFKLAGHIRRQLGKKVLELGGNAVLGFKQSFDMESEKKAITVRAIGTAVKISSRLNTDESLFPLQFSNHEHQPTVTHDSEASTNSPRMLPLQRVATGLSRSFPHDETLRGIDTFFPVEYVEPVQEDLVQVEEEKHVGSFDISRERGNTMGSLGAPGPILTQPQNSFANWKQPAEPWPMTLNRLPPSAILGLGGLVSATSVKVLDNDERDIREAWWAELRDEIKAHAKTLHCPFILGYTEQSSINEELVVLHCSGTAALMDLNSVERVIDLASFALPGQSSPRVLFSDQVQDLAKAFDLAVGSNSRLSRVGSSSVVNPVEERKNSVESHHSLREHQRTSFSEHELHNSIDMTPRKRTSVPQREQPPRRTKRATVDNLGNFY